MKEYTKTSNGFQHRGKKRLPSVSKLKRVLWDKYLSPYVRLRDSLETTGSSEACICINCGILYAYKEIQAGHFLPAGRYSILRFDEHNINGECQGCNYGDKFKLRYEANLKRKIGSEAVEGMKLHAELNPIRQWKRNEILDLTETYREKLELLRAKILTTGGN